jgi:hypothetical protein
MQYYTYCVIITRKQRKINGEIVIVGGGGGGGVGGDGLGTFNICNISNVTLLVNLARKCIHVLVNSQATPL